MPKRKADAPSRVKTDPTVPGGRRRVTKTLATEVNMLIKAIRELAAIRNTVEAAAGDILASAEALLEASEKGDAKAEEAAIAIMTACGFHDLVGQRVTKITETLQELKGRMSSVSAERSRRSSRESKRRQKRSRELMLNGPDMPAAAKDQARIDLIFADA